MTWNWDIQNGTDLQIWDHTRDPSTATPLATRTSAEGWSWTGEFPDAVFVEMNNQARTALSNGNSGYAIRTLADGAFEQIERVGGGGGSGDE